MDNSTKSRLAIDLDALEAQLKNVHNQPASQPASSRARNNDPLAELARIVGQDDPYRALLSEERAERPAAEEEFKPRRRREPKIFADDGDHAGQFAEDSAAGAMPDPGFNALSLRGTPSQPKGEAPEQYQARFSPAAEGGHPQVGHGIESGEAHEAHHDDDHGQDGQDDTLDGGDDGIHPPLDDEPQERRSRKGLVAVGAVVAVAVIVGGAAFAWRGSGSRGVAGEPPVIAAEKAPTKVQVAKTGADDVPNKQIYDSKSSKGATQDNTKIVNSNEQPVDIAQVLRPDGAGQAQAGTTRSLGGQQPPGEAGVSVPVPPQSSKLNQKGDEPKRVRSVVVNPDGSIASGAQQAEPVLAKALVDPPAQSPSKQPAQGGSQVTPSVTGANQKIQVRVGDASDKTEGRSLAPLGIGLSGAGAQKSAAPPQQSQAQSQGQPSRRVADAAEDATAGSIQKPAAQAQPVRREPSAAPDDAAAAKASAAGSARKPAAQEKPAAQAPAKPARVAVAAAQGASTAAEGGFAVQLAAPGSEQEARETFASLQKKHPGELSGRRPIIRQAQVGGKTIWRLRVSASSKDDATSMCTRLQAVGGACFVAKN